MKYIVAIVLCVAMMAGVSASAQNHKGINISGVVMDADSLGVVPYVSIRLEGTLFGTVADNQGHFNFSASVGDTLRFSSIGYFDAYFIMSEKLVTGNSYSLIQLMRRETIMLEEVVVFPYPEYEQMVRAFLKADPPRNMDDLRLEAKKMVRTISKEEYSRNKYYYNVYHNNQLYNMTGIVPSNNFLDPINWSNFIQDLKTKKFKQD